jgi:hypothetical protein
MIAQAEFRLWFYATRLEPGKTYACDCQVLADADDTNGYWRGSAVPVPGARGSVQMNLDLAELSGNGAYPVHKVIVTLREPADGTGGPPLRDLDGHELRYELPLGLPEYAERDES